MLVQYQLPGNSNWSMYTPTPDYIIYWHPPGPLLGLLVHLAAGVAAEGHGDHLVLHPASWWWWCPALPVNNHNLSFCQVGFLKPMIAGLILNHIRTIEVVTQHRRFWFLIHVLHLDSWVRLYFCFCADFFPISKLPNFCNWSSKDLSAFWPTLACYT